MGCGQSKIHLYPRKSKSKANGKKSGNVDMVDPDAEEDDEGHKDGSGGGGGGGGAEKELNGHGKGHSYHMRNEDDDNGGGLMGDTDMKRGEDSGLNGELSIPMLRGKNLSLLSNQDILSSSQYNFFKMLDQKIEEGPDYDSTSETEIALEEARLNALVQHWESASLTASLCSSASRSLNSTPIRQTTAPPPMRMMSPKRDQRVLPQTVLLQQQQQQQQGYNTMPMMTMPVQQTQPQPPGLVQYQYQGQAMPPTTYLPQQYVPATSGVPGPGGILRMGPRMLPVGGAPSVGGMVPGNGVIGSAMPPQSSTIRIPVSYYSQQPPPLQMAGYPGAAATGVPIPQANANQPGAYYGELMQHPLQVPQQPQMNPMMGYNPLMGMVMDGSAGGVAGGGAAMAENKVFPAAISVQRLAPQVQRQLRETQELIKDSCQGLGYGSPGPPMQQQQPPQLQPQSVAPLQQQKPSGPPPPPQRTSTLRKNVNAAAASGVAGASAVGGGVGGAGGGGGGGVVAAGTANNNTSFEPHPQDYS